MPRVRPTTVARGFAVASALLVLFLAVLASSPGLARAQRGRGSEPRRAREASATREAATPEAEEARRLFAAGLEAIERGLWAEALGAFERAYRLTRVPSALRNVALALRGLGRHREARDAFATLLREHALDPEARREVLSLRDEEQARLAHLSIAGLERGEGIRLRLDGEPLSDDGRRPLLVELDPTAHALVAELVGFDPFVWEGTLAEGSSTRLELVFTPTARSDDTLLHVALGVGGALLVAIAASVVGYVAWDDGRVEPSFARRISL